jgi:plastocyanin
MTMQTTNPNSTSNTTKKLRSRILIGACIALLAFALAACSSSSKSSGSTSAGSPDITIANLTFKPNPATVKGGATVTVKNTDDLTHTVTSDDGSSFNITVNAGSTATFTAPSKAGSYKYHCNIHSTMHGVLTVS